MTANKSAPTFPELLAKVTPGPWDADSIANPDAEYGEGDESHRGFDSYLIADSNGRTLFDTLNRDQRTSLIEEEHDEFGTRAWDEQARKDAAYIARLSPEVMKVVWEALVATRNNGLDTNTATPEVNRAIAALNATQP